MRQDKTKEYYFYSERTSLIVLVRLIFLGISLTIDIYRDGVVGQVLIARTDSSIKHKISHPPESILWLSSVLSNLLEFLATISLWQKCA